MKPLLNLQPETLIDMQIVDWGYTTELKARTYSHFKRWIDKGMNTPLGYLSDERGDKREDLRHYFSDAKSAIVFLFDYTPAKKFISENSSKAKIASYTQGFDGKDYHFWIRERLEKIGDLLISEDSSLEFKVSLDIHPVLERDLAYRAGLGWFGKNTMLISQKHGSFFLIGSLILNKELKVKTIEVDTDHCGSCTRCIDACPTNAILENGLSIDTSKCISTHTIEVFKDEKPPVGYPTKTEEVFGCDICQDVCPWNTRPMEKAKSGICNDKFYKFFNREISEIWNDIESMSNNEFKRFFFGTSFYRSGKRGLLKNLRPYLLA